MIFLVPSLSLVFALWVFFDSQKHGFSFGRGLLWSILVFVGWIIFLPLYLVVRRKARDFAEPQKTASPSCCVYLFLLPPGLRREAEGLPPLWPKSQNGMNNLETEEALISFKSRTYLLGKQIKARYRENESREGTGIRPGQSLDSGQDRSGLALAKEDIHIKNVEKLILPFSYELEAFLSGEVFTAERLRAFHSSNLR